MATTKRIYVFATCILSGIAALFTIISLATEQWVVSDSIQLVEGTNDQMSQRNRVRYGLFQGTYFQTTPSTFTFQLSMTCSLKENICAVLCTGDSEILSALYQGQNGSQSDPMLKCPVIHRVSTYRNRPITYSKESMASRTFINCGVWVSTIIFLVLSLAFGVLSSALALFNTVNNPVQVFLSIQGLYIYNAMALCGSVIALASWGIMHPFITYHNVAIYYTITGQMSSDKVAYLGYSYWINIIPIVFYCGSITVLYIRQYLLSKDPGHKIVEREDNADPVIYLY
ncbi:unnamed protein product [Phaedon cochleariae]|uniref:Clarin-3 n=1 Tax=Phaedon cochleariae TaxID=80249 RepID=A0A9P0GS52_PHACE|nr:unnamed protein product [Phaedon cochleariae]